jgi:hypothetical protein
MAFYDPSAVDRFYHACLVYDCSHRRLMELNVQSSWLARYLESFPSRCPVCRQPLAAQKENCPHCGIKLSLGLKVMEVYLISWGVAVGGAAVLAGFGFFIAFVMIARRPTHWTSTMWICSVAIAALGFCMAVVLLLLLLFRRRFCRLSGEVQRLTAVSSCGLVLLSAAAFFFSIKR